MTQAKEKYKNAQNAEEIQLARYSNEIDNYIVGDRDGYVNYSENEQVIGKWINGKDVYQRTFVGTSPSNADGEFFEIKDLDVLISINGIIKDQYGNYISNKYDVPYRAGETGKFCLSSSETGLANKPYVITLKYTKK